jgi:hypothetical protein
MIGVGSQDAAELIEREAAIAGDHGRLPFELIGSESATIDRSGAG